MFQASVRWSLQNSTQHVIIIHPIFASDVFIKTGLQFRDNLGVFDAVWDRGGMGSVNVKDRQK